MAMLNNQMVIVIVMNYHSHANKLGSQGNVWHHCNPKSCSLGVPLYAQ